MTVINAALMGAKQPPLGQRSDPVHAGQQPAGILTAGAGGPLAASFVAVAELVDADITLPAPLLRGSAPAAEVESSCLRSSEADGRTLATATGVVQG